MSHRAPRMCCIRQDPFYTCPRLDCEISTPVPHGHIHSIKDKAQQPYILAPYRYYMDESKELPNFGLPPEPGNGSRSY
jgi:hypothetical protein